MTNEMAAGLWGAALGAAAGGLVSFFSERLHDSRRRKQALQDQFTDLSFDFLASVQAYWSSNGLDTPMQASILSGLNKMKAKLVQLGVDLVNDHDIRLLVKEIYQFSTGGGFSTRDRSAEPTRARNVEIRVEKLSSELSRFIAYGRDEKRSRRP